MAFRTEDRITAFGAPTRSELADRNDRARRRDLAARQRYTIAKTVANLPGSLREKRKFLEMSIAAGTLDIGSAPAPATIKAAEERWNAGGQSIEDYYDAFRSGRPREVLPTVIEREIQAVLQSGRAVNASDLTARLTSLALEHGVKGPTYRQIHGRFSKAGRLIRSAARHGSRAGEIDGFPHARVVTRFSHDTWALDELTVPVYVGLYYPPLQTVVSVLCDVVLIIDVCSTACVGYHLADPSRRMDENGLPMLSGFDSDDVLAALLSASNPELATDATQAFAGYLPDRLRWDNAQAHKTVRAMLDETQIGIDIRPIRKRRPASNGAVERRVGILKQHCQGMLGHVDDYLPTDRVGDESADLPRQRTVAAGYTGERETRRIPIDPEQLMTVDELRGEFDKVVYRYNFERAHRIHRLTPIDKYQRDRKPRRPRRGIDLVRAMEPKTVLVNQDGIVYQKDGETHQFFPLFGGKMIMLDQPVTFHPDPLGRGIFIKDGERKLEFLAPQRTYSDAKAAEIAKSQTSVARLISDTAEEKREDEMRARFGQAALDKAAAEYEAQVERLKNAKESEPAEKKPARPASGAVDLPEFNPWLNDNPEAFIRPVEEG